MANSPQQNRKPPVAPPVYRPQPKPNTAQAKMAMGVMLNPKPPAAPAVYRPQPASQSAQPKMAGTPRLPKPPVAPPAYRPKSAPIALQAKPAASTNNQVAAQIRVSAPMRIGKGSYRITAGTGSQQIGSVVVHERDQSSIQVTDLSVDQAHRKQGLGNTLIASALRTGLQLGRTRVVLNSQDNGSGRLTHWYQSMGFARTGASRRGYPQLEANISRVLSGVAQRTLMPATAPPVYRAAPLSPASATVPAQAIPHASMANGVTQRYRANVTTGSAQPATAAKPAKSHCGCNKCSCSGSKTKRKPFRIVQRQTIQRQVIQRMDDSSYSSEMSASSEDFSEGGCAEDNCITADCDVKDTYHNDGTARSLGQTIRSRFYGGFITAVDPTWKNARLLARQGACGVGNFSCEHCNVCYANATASIDHIVPVVAHWNASGYNTDQFTRQLWYNNIANLRVVYAPHNSSLGGGGQVYRRDVTTNFSGNQNC